MEPCTAQLPSETQNTILVVDDNEDDVTLVARRLAQAGFNDGVVPIFGGERAISFLSSKSFIARQPLLCLLDIKMPGTHGFDVLSWIRRHRRLDTLPVVMLSTSDDPRDIEEAATLGAQGYLQKLPTPEILQQVIACARFYAGLDDLPFATKANLLGERRNAGRQRRPAPPPG